MGLCISIIPTVWNVADIVAHWTTVYDTDRRYKNMIPL